MEFLNKIIEILTGGLIGIGKGMGSGIEQMVNSIFVSAAGDDLSKFGVFIIVFAAISLGLGLFRWVLNFFTSLGNRNQ